MQGLVFLRMDKPMYDLPLFLFFIGSALLNLILAFYGWRHRQVPGALAFGLAMFLFAFLPLTQAVNLSSSDLNLKVVALKIRADVSSLAALAWVIMLMQYTGYGQYITRRFLILMALIPALFVIFNWTENPLFRSHYVVDQVGSLTILHWDNGPLFWLGLICLNALLLAPLVLLWQSFGRISPLTFQQTLALSISTILPIIVNILGQAGFSPFQGVNFPFAAGPVMGLIVALAVFRFRIFAVLPIARSLLIENMSDGVLVLDTQNQIVDINPAMQKLIGVAALGQPIEKALINSPELLERFLNTNEIQTEIKIPGEPMGYFDLRISPLVDQPGHPLGRIIVVRDITRHKQMEEQLRIQATALRSAANAIVITDSDGYILWVNDAFTLLTGYTSAEAVGRSTQLLRSGRHSQPFYEHLWNTIRSGGIWKGEIINRRKDGTEYVEYQIITPVRDEQNQISHFIAVKQDITERRRADEELQLSLKRMELLYEITRTGITARDPRELLQEVVQYIAHGLPANRATLITFDLAAKKIMHVVGGGVGTQHVVQTVSYDELMNGLTGWTIRTGEVAFSAKGEADPRESEAVQKRREETNCGSVIVAPLRHQQKLFGTLTVINLPTEPDFTRSDVELLRAIAGQVSLGIDKLTLEENLHRNNEQLSALHRTILDLLNQRDVDDVLHAIVSDATRLLDAQYGDLDIVENDVFITRAFTENQNLVQGLQTPRGTAASASWQAYDTREPVIINDYANWPERHPVFEGIAIHATIILPLVSANRCLGVFSISRAEVDQPFTDSEVQLATLFAQQAALALDNAQLHTSAQHEIEQRKQTEEALRSQNNYLAALHELTLGLINRLDLDSLLEVMLANFVVLMNTRHAFIEMVDTNDDVLVQKVAVGKYVEQNGFRTAKGMGLTGRVWETGEMLVIPNYSTWEGRLREYLWLRTVAGIPLKVSGKVIGVIGVAYDEPDHNLSAPELDLLQRFANLASVALDNAKLFSSMVRQSQELSLLHKVRTAITSELNLKQFVKRTVEAIAETFGYTLVSLYLLEGDTLILQHQIGYEHVITEIPVTKGVLGRVIQTGQPVLLEDVRSDSSFLGAIENIRSEVAVPIFDEGRIVGALNVETRFDTSLTEADLGLMIALSEQVGIAIGRTRLYDSLHENNERLSLLHEIALDLLKPRATDDLLQSMVDQFVRLMDAVGGFVALAEGNELVDRAITPRDSTYQMVRGGRDVRKGPPWQVFESRQVFVTEDYTALENIRPATAALGMKATLILPILYGENCLGVLAAARLKPEYPFNAEDIKFGNLFARLAAVAMDNAQLHEALRQDSIRDPLTNLYNRRFMEESLAKELQRAHRNSAPLVVVMIDLDHLKTLNDTYGHSLGDEALYMLSKLIKIRIRASDIACRYGGDEFTIILPEVTLENARQRMEELIEDARQMKIRYQGQLLTPVTMSVGIAAFPTHGTTRETLLKSADQALYRAKQNGRDQVVTA